MFFESRAEKKNLTMVIVKKPTKYIGKAAVSFGEISGN